MEEEESSIHVPLRGRGPRAVPLNKQDHNTRHRDDGVNESCEGSIRPPPSRPLNKKINQNDVNVEMAGVPGAFRQRIARGLRGDVARVQNLFLLLVADEDGGRQPLGIGERVARRRHRGGLAPGRRDPNRPK